MGSDDARWKHVVRLARHSPKYEPFRLWAGLVVDLDDELAALHSRAELAEREREVMLRTMVEYDPTYPKAPWVVNKPWGYRLPYRWYLTEAEARAAAYRALGLAAAPAGDPETSDRAGTETDETDTHRGPNH